ncbi:hypothetical protein C810_01326 [Lachnospiraceae bacterium A2]|nr:hypothetical protein C810_01326 [Lachnospiraceae bacterium A2]
MAQYPTYSFQQPQMNPYQNSYQPIQNPYMAQMNQYQQGAQMFPVQSQNSNMVQQPPGLIGKMVNDVSTVSPNDVPMDGNIAIFPKNDMSEIYCKQWKQDGTIQTVVYKPILDQNQSEGTNIPQMDFNALNEDVRALREDIKGVRDMIEKSMAVSAAKTSQRGKKAEVNADE